MITVIKEGKTPTYEIECYDCETIFRFHKADIERVNNELGYIFCPLCGKVNYTYQAREVEASTDS